MQAILEQLQQIFVVHQLHFLDTALQMEKTAIFYIGLMSGTSLDGIDAVLVEIPNPNNIRLIRTHFLPLEDKFRERLKKLSLAQYEGDPIVEFGLLHRQTGVLFAQAVNELLEKESVNVDKNQVVAIGSHGITVRHCPTVKNNEGKKSFFRQSNQ